MQRLARGIFTCEGQEEIKIEEVFPIASEIIALLEQGLVLFLKSKSDFFDSCCQKSYVVKDSEAIFEFTGKSA